MIDVRGILDRIGIEYKDVGNDFKVSCWYHDETVPSMLIHKEQGMYHCFSCDRSGSIFDIVKQFMNFNEDIELIKFVSTYKEDTNQIDEDIRHEELNLEFSGRLKNAPVDRIIVELPEHETISDHPYLKKRGFTTEEITEWDMKVVTESPYAGWILIPIYQNGKLLTYFMRSSVNKRKLYGKFPRKNILVGLDKASDFDRPLYITEGIFDMIYLRRAGIQVVAALSNRLYSDITYAQQLELLKQYKHVVIVPDGDSPGLQLVHDALELIWHGVIVEVCSLPDAKKDTAECTLRELYHVVESKKHILDYITSKRYQTWYHNKILENQKKGRRKIN